MKHLSRVLLCFSALAVADAQAENLFFNGSFELGKCGYSFDRFYRPKVNPKLESHLPAIDPGTKSEGKVSLRIDNPFGEEYRLQCRDFLLPADAEIHVSFQAKGSGAVNAQTDFRAPGKPLNLRGKYCRLTPEWKKYEFSFRTGKDQGGGYMLRFERQPGDKGSIWLDDIRVSVADRGDQYSGLEAGVEPGAPVYDRGETASATLHIRNTTDRPYSGKIPVVLHDDYFKTDQPVFEAEVKLAPGESAALPFSFPTERIGAFSLSPQLPGGRSYHGSIAVLGRYTPRKLDFTRDACVGFNGGTASRFVGNTQELCYPATNMNPDQRLGLMARLGIRLLRSHDSGYSIGSWYLFEPERGVYNTEKFDFDLPLYRKHKIEMLAVPLNSDFIERRYGFETYRFRDWLLPLCEKVKFGRHNQLYPLKEEFRRFIREYARRSAGRIRLFEIFNEPQFCMEIGRYLQYLKIAHEEIKREIPDACIIAFCSTSDKGENIARFTIEGLKAGGAAWCDAISFHPYATPQIGSPYPADEQIREFHRQIAPFHAPVTWNTELFYLRQADYRDHYNSSLFEPHHAATRFLTDLGEGVTQSCPVHIDSVWKKTIHERFRAFVSLNGTDGTFSAIGVAYNPLARFFEGARPVDKIRYPNGVICYVFTRDGREIAALWNYASRRDLSVDLSAFDVMDLFGNPIAEAKALHLSAAPYYLRPKNGEKSFGTLLKNLEIRMDQLIQVQRAARLITDQSGRSILRVTLFNTGNREVKCSAGLGGRLICPDGTSAFTIDAGKSFTLDLPCKVKSAAGEAYLGLIADGRSSRIPLEVTENPAAPAGTEQSFRSRDSKLEASFRLERKGKVIELVVHVKDATDSGAEANDRALWDQDCVELFFDRNPAHSALEHPEKYTGEVFRLFLLPRWKANRTHFMNHPVKTTAIALPCSVETTQEGYTVKLSIPESLLPAKGKELGFEIKVDDAENASGKPVREACWANGKQPFRNRLAFGIIQGLTQEEKQ